MSRYNRKKQQIKENKVIKAAARQRREKAFERLSNLVRLLYIIKKGYSVDRALLNELHSYDMVPVKRKISPGDANMVMTNGHAIFNYNVIVAPYMHNLMLSYYLSQMVAEPQAESSNIVYFSTNDYNLIYNRLIVAFRWTLKEYHLNNRTFLERLRDSVLGIFGLKV